jgi:hypothetical protein
VIKQIVFDTLNLGKMHTHFVITVMDLEAHIAAGIAAAVFFAGGTHLVHRF